MKAYMRYASDFDTPDNEIEVNSLEELLALTEKEGAPFIISPCYNLNTKTMEGMAITVYDDYIE